MLERAPLVLLLALPLALAPSRRAEIRFAPAEGLALHKTLTSRSEQSLDSMSVTVNGEEQEQSGDQEQTTKVETRLVVVDRYVARDDERVTKLARRFEEFSGENATELSFGEEEHHFSSEGSCELVDHDVSFVWDADEGEYVASSEDEGVDEDALEDLRFELDFRAVLPEGAVEVGDEWPVDVEGLRAMLRFDQGLPVDWTRTVDGEEQEQGEEADDDAEEPEEEVSGEVRASFTEVRAVDGRKLAVLHLEGNYEVASHQEHTSEQSEHTQSTEADSTLTVELEGELLWDLEGGYCRSCHLEGETKNSITSSNTVDFDGQSVEFEQRSERSGSLAYAAEFEPAE